MKSKDFIKKAYDIYKNEKTVYFWGSFGQLVTDRLIESKDKQYDDWYTPARIAAFKKLIGKRYYAFDCVGLIKGILWGWDEGSIDYLKDKVPDTSANSMLGRLKDVSSDFKDIEPGEAVWMDGHIGIYVGDGKVIESTPAWRDGVQLTACLNIKETAGLHGRKWTKHGKLPWVDYSEIEIKPAAAKPITKPAGKVYIVRSGDTLSQIAEKHHTTIAKLAAINHISNPSLISIGRVIKLS